uniref:RING-type domain-containing protein n=1 Tax=Kalanchoe fedtschenkoi TaxID=63787 RepID=A0A7N0UCB0_KALFE
MSGMIPGVGLDSRRRISYNRCVDGPRFPCLKKPEELGVPDTGMDPATSEARNRLAQRLGYGVSRRSRSRGDSKGDVSKIWAANWSSGLVKNVIFRGFRRFRSRDCEQVCAVCLDTRCEDGEIMILRCSHKYHSKCLLPWLDAHSNCPYCRNPVRSVPSIA